ncbi:hypothetical protein A6A19_00145 [Actinobacillus delphinicola]|uniref:opacity family porin n=1 Tax=Actinobacillus delphinicola TaxID=51161 RepID=UPI00244184B5|nr:opacity family porin [Actinobacillus delphinicola]MDG6896455.1 hypothetical protein [Actinobacillus delphinicola]
MKKSLLATAILGLATATCANAALTTSGTPITGVSPDAQSGFPTDIPVMPYAQIDLGASSINFNNSFLNSDIKAELSNKTTFAQRLAFGADFQGDRIALDFSNYNRIKYNRVNFTPIYKKYIKDSNTHKQILAEYADHLDNVKVRTMGVGLSYIHAMLLNSTVRPYIGARLGYTHFSVKGDVAKMVLNSKSGQYEQNLERVKENYNKASIGGLAGVEVDVARNVTLGIGAEYDSLWGSKATAISGNAFMRVYF